MAPTTSGFELISGAPEQFTLMPTMSEGTNKRLHACLSSLAPVSPRIPAETIVFTGSKPGIRAAIVLNRDPSKSVELLGNKIDRAHLIRLSPSAPVGAFAGHPFVDLGL